MHKATPGTFRSLRHIAEEKNQSAGFEAAPQVQGGEVSSPTHPGGSPGTAIAQNYKDTAEQAKPNHPTGVHEVFTFTKGK